MVSQHRTTVQAIVSAAIWGAAIGAVAGGRVADSIGRRASLALADVLFTAGSLAMAAAPSVLILVLGRVLVGLGIGVASVTVPVLIAEVSPAEVRARAVTVNVLAITGASHPIRSANSVFGVHAPSCCPAQLVVNQMRTWPAPSSTVALAPADSYMETHWFRMKSVNQRWLMQTHRPTGSPVPRHPCILSIWQQSMYTARAS